MARGFPGLCLQICMGLRVCRIHAQDRGAARGASVPPSAPASRIPASRILPDCTAQATQGPQTKLPCWQGPGSAPPPLCCLSHEAIAWVDDWGASKAQLTRGPGRISTRLG